MNAIGPTDDFPALLALIGRGSWVGRAREMAEAAALWQQVSSGEGRVLWISGDPGVGKTRFVHQLSAAAQADGASVLSGACYAEGSAPYAALANMLAEYFESHEQTAIELPDEILSNLAALLPALRQRFPGRISEQIPDPQSFQPRIFDGFLRFCSSLSAQKPLLIFIDDVHWADNDTLSLLRSLARLTRKLPVMIVLTYREAEFEWAPALKDLLLDLNRERLAAHLSLVPLDRTETADLLTAMFSRQVTPEFLAGVYTQTEGNPFFIEEVCKALIETGQIAYRDSRWQYPDMGTIKIPQTVRSAIQARLRQLPEISQDVLRMAAILGREFDFQTLRRAAGLDDETLIGALESALKAQIILEAQSNLAGAVRFEFVHVLIPTTLRESIMQIRRQRLHLQAAEAIAAVHPDDYEALAYHFSEAGELVRAGGCYRLAGDRARLVAPAEAARFYRAALERWPVEDPAGQAEITAQLGYCLWILVDLPEALHYYEDAYNRYEHLQNRIQSGDIQRMIGRLHWEHADHELAFEHYYLAYNILKQVPESPELARAISAISQMYLVTGEDELAISWGERALSMAERIGLEDVVLHALNNIGCAYAQLGDFERGIPLVQDSLRRSLAANLSYDACRAYFGLGVQLQRQCRYASARDLLLEMLAYSKKFYTRNNILALTRLMWIDWLTGNWDSALDYRSQLGAFSKSVFSTWADRIVGLIDLDLGRIDTGLHLLEDNLPRALQIKDMQTTVPHLGQLARAYSLAGQDEKMIETLRRLSSSIAYPDTHSAEQIMPLLIACKEFARRSQPAQAQACLKQLNEQAQRYQTGEASAALAEANGYLAEKSQPQAAAQHFRAAAEEWKKIGRPYDEGRALSSLSRSLAAYGDQPSAKQAAGQALRLFNDLADQLDPESRAVFLNTPELLSLRQTVTDAPHHPMGQKADELTARELEVLRLVVQGLTNAQIAERLVLSPLTVNSHLRSIFNKLDVNSRTAAAHVAMQRGWG